MADESKKNEEVKEKKGAEVKKLNTIQIKTQ